MKKVNVILLFAVFLVAGNVGYSGTVASPYEVGTWQGFRTAAITYTFDDDLPDQLVYAVPYMDSNGFAGTLFTVTSSSWYMPPNWTGLQNAASNGFEIASHTVDHSDLSGMSSSAQITEYSQSQATINSYIPGNQCLTIAYPNCDEGTQSLISQYYIAGRVCSGQIMPATPSNFYQLSCFILGSAGINTLSGIEAEDNAAASSGGWCVFLIHAMDSENGYSPISHTLFQQSIQYLAANRSTFWVNTFLNVVKYIKERNDVSISESSNTGDSITLAVTDTLSNTIYNYPITIRRPLPAGWEFANVSQNAQPVPSSIVEVNSTAYVMFDVVPNGGDVVLSSIYGDFTGNGAVDLNDLSVFCDYWLASDCNESVDLNGDCIVNFYEFAFLARNWLQAQ